MQARDPSGDAGLLLFSGGVDSTLTALHLTHRNLRVWALTIDYEGRPRGERRAVDQLIPHLSLSGVTRFTIGHQLKPPEPSERVGALEGWIPYRNLLFWSIAAHVAGTMGLGFVSAGHELSDGPDYSDASPRFFELLEPILQLTGRSSPQQGLKIELPLLMGPESAAIEREHQALLRKTWSCWRDADTPCGSCYACQRRAAYFDSLARDPR